MNIEQFIEQNIDLIDSNKFTELYDRCVVDNRGSLTEVMYECDINPLDYMTEVPPKFAFNTDLTSITIPDSVKSIGYKAFYKCTALTSITIPDSVMSIGYSAFIGCTSLTSVTIPDGVTSIDYGTFYNCISLTSITIPNSVTSIGRDAFFNCENLTGISILSSVTSMGEATFGHCGHIEITYSGTKQQWKNLVTGKKIFPGTTYVCNCSDGIVKKSR